MDYKLDKFDVRIKDLNYISELIIEAESKVFVIDKNVWEKHKLESIIANSPKYVYSASEENKNYYELEKIYDFFLKSNVNRKTTIIAIGGGITCDLAAYAASTYKRGCELILVPTTLLAMVDAAIGGKTAINFHNIKNCIGSFYPAKEIFIINEFLKTLSEDIYLNGVAEVVKTLFISNDIKLLKDSNISKEVLLTAVNKKMQICQADLYEQNIRKKLNLGHTFGHVLESCFEYTIPHGICVALGMRIAAKLSLRLNKITNSRFNEINEILDSFGLPKYYCSYYPRVTINKLKNILIQDKKFTKIPTIILFDNEGVYVENSLNLEVIAQSFFLD